MANLFIFFFNLILYKKGEINVVNMDRMKNIGEKEEKKGIKSFLKKHRSKIALGVVTIGGFYLSRYAYKLGYDNGKHDGGMTGYDAGYNDGFKEACNFNEDKYKDILETGSF